MVKLSNGTCRITWFLYETDGCRDPVLAIWRRGPFPVHGSDPRDAQIFPTTILLYMTFLLHRKIIILMMVLSPFGVSRNVKSVTKSRLSLGKLVVPDMQFHRSDPV